MPPPVRTGVGGRYGRGVSALAQSKSAWDAWRDMKPQSDPDLTESYQRFYSGIQEQADGLMQSGSIDAFFAVPVQALSDRL